MDLLPTVSQNQRQKNLRRYLVFLPEYKVVERRRPDLPVASLVKPEIPSAEPNPCDRRTSATRSYSSACNIQQPSWAFQVSICPEIFYRCAKLSRRSSNLF